LPFFGLKKTKIMRNFCHFFWDIIKNWTRLKKQYKKFRNFLDMSKKRFWARLKKVIRCYNNLPNFFETPPSRIPAYATGHTNLYIIVTSLQSPHHWSLLKSLHLLWTMKILTLMSVLSPSCFITKLQSYFQLLTIPLNLLQLWFQYANGHTEQCFTKVFRFPICLGSYTTLLHSRDMGCLFSL